MSYAKHSGRRLAADGAAATEHSEESANAFERQQHPDMTTARRLSDLDQKQWRAERQQRKWEAKQRVRLSLIHI